ncbi:MAG: UDP-3-O-(3-hydroxymyristoyl)glucosamine N-acyltransferase [Burkholderiales bacterium]
MPVYRVADIVARLGGELLGDGSIPVRGVGTLANAQPDEAAFLAHGKYRKQLASTRAGVVILPPDEAAAVSCTRIVSPDPYGYFAHVSRLLNPPPVYTPGVDPSAVVHPEARLDPSASVGPLVSIGRGAQIGAHTVIESGCAIGEHVQIGPSARLHANVVIYHHCILGERVILHAGVVIGADGFGFAPEDGRWNKIPQVGRVIIGDDVEVGANTTIDRGALDDTVIEEGAKLDNQIQIGHNCRIGAHTAIAGCVGIAGSTTIGKHCRIGGGAMISGHLDIADEVGISGGTLISKSIRDRGQYTAVFPFSSHERWLKNAVQVKHLDALAQRIKALEDRAGEEKKR